jgi:hypothetical protein
MLETIEKSSLPHPIHERETPRIAPNVLHVINTRPNQPATSQDDRSYLTKEAAGILDEIAKKNPRMAAITRDNARSLGSRLH